MSSIRCYCFDGEEKDFKTSKDIYINYLKDPSNNKNNIYYDHDSLELKNEVFYNEISKYLNKIFNKTFNKTFNIIDRFDVKKIDNKKIKLIDTLNNIELHTDQFGFSAPEFDGEKWDNHPYGNLLNSIMDKKNISEIILECIVNTRTIGGCFFWPKTFYLDYNKQRGLYLEDRVDFTLIEIKDILDDCNLLSKNYLKSRLSDHNLIQKFKETLGKFKCFVERMSFNDFVDKNYDVIDILNSDLANNKKVYFDRNSIVNINKEWCKKNKTINSVKNCDSAKTLKAIRNVSQLSLLRTNRMEKIIGADK